MSSDDPTNCTKYHFAFAALALIVSALAPVRLDGAAVAQPDSEPTVVAVFVEFSRKRYGGGADSGDAESFSR